MNGHESLSSHSGREYVLSLVRRKYWITKPRSLINKVLKGCFTCRRLYAQPEQQHMADLVEERIIPGRSPMLVSTVLVPSWSKGARARKRGMDVCLHASR